MLRLHRRRGSGHERRPRPCPDAGGSGANCRLDVPVRGEAGRHSQQGDLQRVRESVPSRWRSGGAHCTEHGRVMRVPLLDLKAQYATIREEIREALDRVLESQQFIMGPEVTALQKAVADYVGAPHGIRSSSTTAPTPPTFLPTPITP